MNHPGRARLCLLGALVCSLLLTGCESQQNLVDRQHKALISFRSSVVSVCHAWLDGNVTTTYARTALEAVAVLLEKERTETSGSPDALADPSVASVSNSEQQLAYQIALLRKALAESDADGIRKVMSAIEGRRAELP